MTPLPILEFTDQATPVNIVNPEHGECCFSWVTGKSVSLLVLDSFRICVFFVVAPADLSEVSSLNPSLITTLHLSQPQIRIHPTVLGTIQLLLLKPNLPSSSLDHQESLFETRPPSHSSTLEWLLGPSLTLQTGSGEQGEIETQPKRVAVWLPFRPFKLLEGETRNEIPGDKHETNSHTTEIKGEEITRDYRSSGFRSLQAPGNLFVQGMPLSANVRHMFVRAEWLSAQADHVIKDAMTAEFSPVDRPKGSIGWIPTVDSSIGEKTIGRNFENN